MSGSQPVAHDPAIIVIFGITGDLARSKVLPAIYRLFASQLVHEQTYIVGTSRHHTTPDDIMSHLRQTLGDEADEASLVRLYQHLRLVQLQPDIAEDYQGLKTYLQTVEDQAGVCLQRFFYLSIPPQVFTTVVHQLGEQGLQHGCDHGNTVSRLLIEKPFGYDTQSAKDLIAKTAEHFEESQLFRIDHYLAKETAQNILVFRQRNPLFNQIWNNRHITRISITAAEAIGIEGRSNFYDQTGALRDLIQSHLMQLLAMTLMEVPAEITSGAVHSAKLKVLEALEPVPADKVGERTVRGQYSGYRAEVGNDESLTETYAAIVLYSQDEHWQNIPILLTTGKALKIKRTSITVDFGDPGINRLQFRIQPNEGITLALQVKQPGLTDDVTSTTMDFDYETAFSSGQLDAYDRVLIDAMRGDQTLFASDQEVLASWRVLQPIIDAWQGSSSDLDEYEPGSDGPDAGKLVDL